MSQQSNDTLKCTFHFHYNDSQHFIKCGSIPNKIEPYELIDLIKKSNNNTLKNLSKIRIIQHITTNCNPIDWIMDINSELKFNDGKVDQSNWKQNS